MTGDFFDFDVRVRYLETDQMRVAHHASYLAWFEVGRTEFCRSRGFTYHDLEEMGYLLMMTDLRCHYKKAVRYDEMITIRTWVKDLKRRMMSFGYQILIKENGEAVAEGETRHICLDPSGRPRAIPESFRHSLENSR